MPLAIRALAVFIAVAMSGAAAADAPKDADIDCAREAGAFLEAVHSDPSWDRIADTFGDVETRLVRTMGPAGEGCPAVLREAQALLIALDVAIEGVSDEATIARYQRRPERPAVDATAETARRPRSQSDEIEPFEIREDDLRPAPVVTLGQPGGGSAAAGALPVVAAEEPEVDVGEAATTGLGAAAPDGDLTVVAIFEVAMVDETGGRPMAGRTALADVATIVRRQPDARILLTEHATSIRGSLEAPAGVEEVARVLAGMGVPEEQIESRVLRPSSTEMDEEGARDPVEQRRVEILVLLPSAS